MSLFIVLVFCGVFAIVLLLSMTFDSSRGQTGKQAQQRLESISMAASRKPEDEAIGLVREELISSLPLVNQWLQRLDLFSGLRRLLSQADMTWTVMGVLLMSILSALVAGTAVYLRTNGIFLSVLLGAAASAGPMLYILRQRSVRFGKFEEALPGALDLMVSALRAGHSLISALESVCREMPNPLGGEFRKCFDEQNFGLELRESMLNMAARVPIHDVHIVVTAILIQKESGGNLAEILEKVAYIIRERFQLKRQVRVHTAQGRLTGFILAFLPLFLGIALYLLNPEHMSILWRHPLGLKLMYVATVMTLIGGLIIRKIVNIRI